MNPLMIAQLAVILAPIAKEVWVEGNKIFASFKDTITQDDLNKALELSKSATWPELDFKIDPLGPKQNP